MPPTNASGRVARITKGSAAPSEREVQEEEDGKRRHEPGDDERPRRPRLALHPPADGHEVAGGQGAAPRPGGGAPPPPRSPGRGR